jgi:hypothetical protein
LGQDKLLLPDIHVEESKIQQLTVSSQMSSSLGGPELRKKKQVHFNNGTKG